MRQVSSSGFNVCLLSLLVFISPFSTIPATGSNSAAALLWEAADAAGKSNDLTAKEGLCRRIIAEFPDTPQAVTAYRDVAILCIQSRRIEEAESWIESLKTDYFTSSETVDALYSIAQHWQWNGLPDQAIRLHRYNSATYSTVEKGMWSQGAIIHYFIEQKDFANAQADFEVMADRFQEQVTFPQEVYQFALKYHRVGAPEKALELHRYNVNNSPVSSKFTMWSQGAIVHYLIEQKDFINAQIELNVMLDLFHEHPTLPQEIHQTAEKYRTTGEPDRAYELHRFNTLYSPVSSKYTMWSQGALVHHFIEQGGFFQADYEYRVLLDRFSDQPTLPQEIYQFALKYKGVGQIDKALELHRYNATQSPASSKHAMWSQGALIHHYIENKEFINAQTDFERMLNRFQEQSELPQEIYQFALKYKGVGQTDKALELHRYNATLSPASSKHAMWSQGALIHHYIENRDFANAQAGYEAMLSRFQAQPTLPQEICYVADKYQGVGQYERAQELCRYGLMTYPDCPWRSDFHKILVKMHLAKKEYEQAASVIAVLVSESTERSAYVRTMTDLGHIYREHKLWEQSIPYFEQALELAESPREKLDVYEGLARVAVWLGDDEAVDRYVDMIISELGNLPEAARAVFLIGEEYLLMARELSEKNDSERERIACRRSIAVLGKTFQTAENTRYYGYSHYMIGMAHRDMGEYFEAADAFLESILAKQDVTSEESIWMLILTCYHNLKERQMISETDAYQIIKEICLMLIAEYPQSLESKTASIYLYDLVFLEKKQTVSNSELAQIKGRCDLGCYLFTANSCSGYGSEEECVGCDFSGQSMRHGSDDPAFGCSYKIGGAVGQSCKSGCRVHYCGDDYDCREDHYESHYIA